MWRSANAVLAAAAAAAVSSCSAISQTQVWPTEAAKFKPIELSALVERALPSNSGFEWDALQTGEVAWITPGIQADRIGYRRSGFARVRVGGRVSTVLRRAKDELAWTVTFRTERAPKFGPSEVSITPGVADRGGCFGSEFDNCTFTPIEALGNIKHRFVCEVGPGSNYSEVYEVSAANGRRGTLVFQRSVGSGGETNEITITRRSGDEQCAQERSAR